jgi:hypothetical protein
MATSDPQRGQMVKRVAIPSRALSRLPQLQANLILTAGKSEIRMSKSETK